MRISWSYLKRVLAGAIFGLYMANLLYFLNPQIDITPGRLALLTVVYGLICGLLFGSILWGLRALRIRLLGRFGPPGGYRPHGFGFVVFAAFVSAFIYWTHLRVYRIYLPIEAIRILSKASNTITATAFALLILWFVERNASRRTSRAVFVFGCILIGVSSLFLYQRRDSYHTDRRNAVVANVGTVAGERPVILVAIRNLPYDWVVTLIGEGTLPFFEESRNQAYFTRLEPFPTTSNKALWASLATGKLPHRHGVTGRFSYRTLLNGRDPAERFLILPGGVGFQAWGLIPPVRRISAQLPSGDSLPLWAMFERLSFRAAVIGWPSVSVNPPRASLIVTDDFFDPRVRTRAAEVFPAAQAELLLRMQPAPDPQLAARFNALGQVPRGQLLDAIGGDRWTQAIAQGIANARQHDLEVVALQGLDDAEAALRIFSNTLPEKTSRSGEGIRIYLEQLDRFLSELARSHPDETIVVVSPSGPEPPTLPVTPFALAKSVLDPDDPGADDGFVLMRGRGVAHRENPAAAQAIDVVPTVLYAAGLPVGRDMDGRVLTDAFRDELLLRNGLSVIQTYDAEQLIVRRGGKR
jgi:Type I phosphodiesterase / nucleotide pyrophosphatase